MYFFGRMLSRVQREHYIVLHRVLKCKGSVTSCYPPLTSLPRQPIQFRWSPCSERWGFRWHLMHLQKKHTFTQILHGGRSPRVIPTTLEKTVVPCLICSPMKQKKFQRWISKIEKAKADLRCIRGLMSILEPPMGIKSPCLDVSQDRATKRSPVQSTMLYQNWDTCT